MNRLINCNQVPGSFRDPCGFLFRSDGRLYRQVNQIYREHYDHLMGSGLYRRLVDARLLIPHEEAETGALPAENAYKILHPERVEFISYPCEWCFSQLKDAALTTLEVQKIALEYGMILKDASAYNIQFHRGRPVLIDTLSFEKYIENQPWNAYRQFCQHFLAPLALMSYKDVRLSQMLRIYIDGLPLDLTSSLLPARTRLSFSLLAHIHLHARQQAHYAEKKVDLKKLRLSLRSLQGIIDQLKGMIQGLAWRPRGTEWAGYYTDNNYSPESFENKKSLVAGFIDRLDPGTIWDLGANTGVFSRIAGAKNINTISFDMDPAAVELNYLDCRKEKDACILPLVSDLTNPVSGAGWENDERMSLIERGPADTVLALALVHHLAISNNVPMNRIARFFNRICRSLIVEFVPKSDSQVRRLLASREDIFTGYNQQLFEHDFSEYFTIEDSAPIQGSDRRLYLMRSRKQDTGMIPGTSASDPAPAKEYIR